MRLSSLILIIGLAVLWGGCGDSADEAGSNPQAGSEGAAAPPGATARSCESGDGDVESLRATGVDCTEARQVMSGWRRARECDKYGGEARTGCSLLSYRCIATAAGRGWSVSCAKPNRSISFLIRRGA